MKIAVIGGGISGLGSALLLEQQHEVHLFETEKRLGGHAHTHKISDSQNNSLQVDTGFLVYNKLTYPHLCGLFDYLKVDTCDSDMSLSIQVPEDSIEWAGENLSTIFANKSHLINYRFLKMLLEIIDLHKNAEKYLQDCLKNSWTLKEFFEFHKFNSKIQDWYIFPMLAAIWSTSEKKMKSFPAHTFFTFFINHKLLQVNERPIWRTVRNGSINYVKRLQDQLKNVHLNESVIEVKPRDGRIELKTISTSYVFDKVVFATHAPVTLSLLKTSHSAIQKLLENFKTSENLARLHKDMTPMPKNKKCWSSWNVIGQQSKDSSPAQLTYFLNRLQPLNTVDQYFLSLNPEKDHLHTELEVTYHHPEFNHQAVQAQMKIPEIQGIDNCYFAGAWTRYGFHEDGLLSAVKVAEKFQLKPIWSTYG